jgi:hypothetical protein
VYYLSFNLILICPDALINVNHMTFQTHASQ